MTFTVSTDELLNMLYARGYNIDITTRDNSKFVTFTSKTAKYDYKDAMCYSTEFTDDEICREAVGKLLKWSGLKIKVTLDY